jgi:uncharacterized membrane protein YedE/YeeE
VSTTKKAWNDLATLLSGLLFGFGLAYATMIRPESVLAFLKLHDMGLMLVLGAAVGLNLLVFQLLPRWRQGPLLAENFEKRPFTLNRQTLLGGVLFGIGWGICGVCPGPAIAGLGAGNFELLYALAGIIAGAALHGLWASQQAA